MEKTTREGKYILERINKNLTLYNLVKEIYEVFNKDVSIFCSVIQIISLTFYKLDAVHPQIIKELAEKNQATEN